MEEKANLYSQKVFTDACIYHITLQGRLKPQLFDLIDDLQVREDQNGIINLVGRLPDQAALMGLLLLLNRKRYGILSVKALLDN